MQFDLLIQWFTDFIQRLYIIPANYIVKNYHLIKISLNRYKFKKKK